MAIKATRLPYGELSEKLRKSGGFTFDPRTGTYPSSGVSVADVGAEDVLPVAGEPELKRYVMRHAARLSEPGAHFGAWARPAGEHTTKADVLDVAQVIPEHPMGHHIADVHHRMHVNRQDAAFDLSTFEDINNPRAPYTEAEKAYEFSEPDEYGSQVRIKTKGR